MEKTYWRQLIELESQVENKGSIIRTLYEDAVCRVGCYITNGCCEEEANLQSSIYAKKNLDFVKELLSIK